MAFVDYRPRRESKSKSRMGQKNVFYNYVGTFKRFVDDCENMYIHRNKKFHSLKKHMSVSKAWKHPNNNSKYRDKNYCIYEKEEQYFPQNSDISK